MDLYAGIIVDVHPRPPAKLSCVQTHSFNRKSE